MIQERISAVNEAMQKVRNHCMCGRVEDDGRRIMVIFPQGDFPTDGARCDYSQNGKAWALNKLHEVMERMWVASYP